MRKKLLKTTFTENLEKNTKFFKISKTYKSKEKFPSANRVSRCSQNNRQASHNRHRNLAKNREKTKNCKKLRKIVPIFAIFCHISQQKKMILTHKFVTNCYHKIAQVEGVSSIPI